VQINSRDVCIGKLILRSITLSTESILAHLQRLIFCMRDLRVVTAVVMKNSIFWDIMPSKVNWYFGGTCCLHLQGQNQRLVYHQLSLWFLAWPILWPRRWRQYVPPKHRLTFNRLHGVICQKIELLNIVFHWSPDLCFSVCVGFLFALLTIIRNTILLWTFVYMCIHISDLQ
jgi:hypothetical protein